MYRIERLPSGPMLLKSVDRVSLGCGKASIITMTEMCGCRSHPLKVGLHFLEPCIRYVSCMSRCCLRWTAMAVFVGIFSLVRIFLHTGSFFENLSGSKVCDVQIVRFIPLSSWFPPKFP